MPKNQNETAGKWGDYNCDSSPRTLEQIGEVIKETGPPEFMLWTGDNVDHAQYLEPRDTTATTVLVTDFVNRWCPKLLYSQSMEIMNLLVWDSKISL